MTLSDADVHCSTIILAIFSASFMLSNASVLRMKVSSGIFRSCVHMDSKVLRGSSVVISC